MVLDDAAFGAQELVQAGVHVRDGAVVEASGLAMPVRARTVCAVVDTGADLVEVELTERERFFISEVMTERAMGSASRRPVPYEILGLPRGDHEAFLELLKRLQDAVRDGSAQTALDWARTMFICEITFSSTFFGAAGDFDTITDIDDAEGTALLRGLQRRIGVGRYLGLLYPDPSCDDAQTCRSDG